MELTSSTQDSYGLMTTAILQSCNNARLRPSDWPCQLWLLALLTGALRQNERGQFGNEGLGKQRLP